MMLYLKMRNGNVPARERNAPVLPKTVREVTVRSDSAGHSAEVIRFCNRPELRPEATRRFGVIGFAIPAVRSTELMAAVEATPEATWSSLRQLEKRTPEGVGKPVLVEVEAEGEAIAEVDFVSQADGYSKREGIVRHVAVRRELAGEPGLGEGELPHCDDKPAYAIPVVVTNIPSPGGLGGGAACPGHTVSE